MVEPEGAGRRVPTVVVARRVRPGRERDFERWVAKLLAAAARAPGYVDARHEPPDAAHPDDWVVVYRFADADLLEQWLRSPERCALIADGADLIDGPAREQVIALADTAEPVTAVTSVRVRPDAADEYRRLHDELFERMATWQGYRGGEILTPVPGVQDEHVAVFTFDTREHLDAWLDSDERRVLLAGMDPLIEGSRTLNVVDGFAGWFGRPGAASSVKRWKQATTVLLALFPTTLAVTAVREAAAPDMAMLPAVLVGT